ncbi:MAG TPA: pyruvate kinase, partial [Anaerolineae bacterium]|nr:pyruvate kinase [Anaerolineae bacterium]
MLRTKIVCTLGPATDDLDTIRAFAEAGMAVARINFSHGTHEAHARQIARVRQVAGEKGCPIAILADLQGPKLRVGLLPGQAIPLVEGEMVRLLNVESTEEPGTIPVPHAEVLRDVRVGDRILMDDGLLELLVTGRTQERVEARVIAGGLLGSRKGVSLPHTGLSMPSITDKDRVDAAFAVQQQADYFALSFVRCADDVQHLRSYLEVELGARTPIIAKIEKPEAVDDIESIIRVSDGIMVARGDLGIEAPAEEVPMIQKRVIKLANRASLPVITATQMLDSMIRNPRPTRAEASDVANAILDGSDAIMLSGETAVGRYAIASVRTMARIAEVTERSLPYQEWLRRTYDFSARDVTEAISQIATEIAAELEARAIVASTMSGSTARRVASHRPITPILAPTPRESTYRQ